MKKFFAIVQFIVVLVILVFLEQNSHIISRIIKAEPLLLSILVISTIVFGICIKFLREKSWGHIISVIGKIILFLMWLLFASMLPNATESGILDILIWVCLIMLAWGSVKLIKEKKWGTELSLIGWIMLAGLLFFFMATFKLNMI